MDFKKYFLIAVLFLAATTGHAFDENNVIEGFSYKKGTSIWDLTESMHKLLDIEFNFDSSLRGKIEVKDQGQIKVSKALEIYENELEKRRFLLKKTPEVFFVLRKGTKYELNKRKYKVLKK